MEMQSPHSPIDVESNIPPVKTDISTVNTETSDGFEIEEVSKGDTFQLGAEEDPIGEEGGIMLYGRDYTISVDPSELGAKDIHGTYYPFAVGEGKKILINGVPATVTYKESPFPEVTFLHFYPDSEGKNVGQVSGGAKVFPVRAYTREMVLNSHVEPIGTSVKVFLDKDVVNVGMPIITAGSATSIFPPPIEDGKIVSDIPKSFHIETTPFTQSNSGYYSWLDSELVSTEEGLVLKVQGIIENSRTGDGIYIDESDFESFY